MGYTNYYQERVLRYIFSKLLIVTMIKHRKEEKMLVTLIGKQNLDFVTKEGKSVVGTVLYVAYKNENIEGAKADRFFVSDKVAIPKEMTLNAKLDLGFNNKGNI